MGRCEIDANDASKISAVGIVAIFPQAAALLLACLKPCEPPHYHVQPASLPLDASPRMDRPSPPLVWAEAAFPLEASPRMDPHSPPLAWAGAAFPLEASPRMEGWKVARRMEAPSPSITRRQD